MFGVLFFLAVILGYIFWRLAKKKNQENTPIPADLNTLLAENIAYFQRLDPQEQDRFSTAIKSFLRTTQIEAVGTTIDDTDRIMVAASAVIPIFGFPEWQYKNLSDVIIYNDHFNDAFSAVGENRQYMGMVGSGYMNGKMLLSKTALREGFQNRTDKNNTAIHEFVHLLDKSDGAVDGVPEAFLTRQYTLPWLDLVHKKMQEILQNKSDINPYGATEKSEFLAVAAEYFFERPDLLKIKHPKLYEMLELIFRQEP
jgi:Mlc titration factor MtfA (ptsG expression regulator)